MNYKDLNHINQPWMKLYPFKSKFIQLKKGLMHYIDEGKGNPILLLHGNPTWSFLYRKFIKPLAESNRVIAIDHLGFGLSDKPTNVDYSPTWHRNNLLEVIECLGIEQITLIVQDWGGPIGLGTAIQIQKKISKIIIMNSWAFPLPEETKLPDILNKIRSPKIGEELIYNKNILISSELQTGTIRKLTNLELKAYEFPFIDPGCRRGMLMLPRHIAIGHSGDYNYFYKLEKMLYRLNKIPILFIWGAKDPIFTPFFIIKWNKYFPDAKKIMISSASHFLQEDAPEEIVRYIKSF